MRDQQKILLLGDIPIHGVPLSQYLLAYGFQLLLIEDKQLAADFITQRLPSVCCVLMNLNHDAVRDLELARRLLEHPDRSQVLAAGIYNPTMHRPQDLKRMGFQLAIDPFATAEGIVDDINQGLFRGKDTRRYVRIFTSLPAKYVVNGTVVACRATSLSLGGIFLQTEQCQPKGSKIDFTLQLKSSESVTGKGTVVHVLQQQVLRQTLQVSGMGVRFDGLDPKGARFLGQFYRARLDRYVDRSDGLLDLTT